MKKSTKDKPPIIKGRSDVYGAPPSHPLRARMDPLHFQPNLPNPKIEEGDPRPDTMDELSDALDTAYMIVLTVIEVLAGRRNADQLIRWTSPALHSAIVRRAGLIERILGPNAIAKANVTVVSGMLLPTGACEGSILLEERHRLRGAAVRMIHRHGRWIMTNLEMG